MKKFRGRKSKALELNRETLKHLVAKETARVRGGLQAWTENISECRPSCLWDCTTFP